MLYNANWNKPRPNPKSMAAVVQWLETKNPEQEYDYCDSGECLAAQYNDSIGREYDLHWALGKGFFGSFSRRFNTFDYRLENVACDYPRTFGAALERARAQI